MSTATDLRHQAPIPKAQLAKVERGEMESTTSMGKFNVCPRSYFLYRKYRGGPSNHALARGECWHDFRERFVQLLVDNSETSAPPEIGKDLMRAVIADRTDLVLPEYEQNSLRAMAWNFSEATIIDPEQVVGLEQTIELHLENGTIRGRLDYAEIVAAFHYALIVDDKTSLAIPSQDEVENGAKSWGGRFYCLLLMEGIPEGESLPLGKGINEFRFRLQYPRFTNSETGELIYREVSYTRDQLVDFKGTVESHLEKINEGWVTGNFPASPGSHCVECPARSECPIPEQFHEIEVIETVEEAQQALELHLTRDAVQRRVMKSVSAFHEDYAAPIFVGDYSFDRRLETRRQVDWDAAGDGPVMPEHIKQIHSTPLRKRKQTLEEREEARNG